MCRIPSQNDQSMQQQQYRPQSNYISDSEDDSMSAEMQLNQVKPIEA